MEDLQFPWNSIPVPVYLTTLAVVLFVMVVGLFVIWRLARRLRRSSSWQEASRRLRVVSARSPEHRELLALRGELDEAVAATRSATALVEGHGWATGRLSELVERLARVADDLGQELQLLELEPATVIAASLPAVRGRVRLLVGIGADLRASAGASLRRHLDTAIEDLNADQTVSTAALEAALDEVAHLPSPVATESG